MVSLNARMRNSEMHKEPRSLSSLSFNNFPMLPSIGEGPQLTLPARVSREQAHLTKSGKDKVVKVRRSPLPYRSCESLTTCTMTEC